MGEYVTVIWGWDEQVQRASNEGAFNPHRWQIITAGQAGIDMLDVDYRPGEIYLSRIEIHPGHQGHGIGSRIISALLEEAQRQGQGSRRTLHAQRRHRRVRRAQRVAQRNRRDAARSHLTLLAGPGDWVLVPDRHHRMSGGMEV